MRDRLDELFLQVGAAAIGGGAIVGLTPIAERFLHDRSIEWAVVLVARFVAAGLDEHDGAVAAAEVANVIGPVAQGQIAEQGSVAAVLLTTLEILCPDQRKDRVITHEERVGTMINVLPAEIPHLQNDFVPPGAGLQFRRDDRHAVSRIARRIEYVPVQASADLRFADSTIA